MERFFFYRLPNNYKRYVLGINSHLNQSIEEGSIDIKRLWFGDFLEQQSTPPEDTAQVDVIFRIIRRTEVLNQQHFDQPKMFEHQQITGRKATHLVEKVVYGVELIISMRRTLDLNFESKASAEGNIYLAAKSFFQTIGPRMKIAGERLTEFKRIKCTIFSSLESRNIKHGTFEDSCKLLQDLLRPNIKRSIYSDKEDKWKPIEIILKFKFNQKLSAEIKARLLTEKMSDVEFEVEKNLAMLKAIIKESNVILKHPSINRVPPFEMAMCQFLDLLVAFQKKIDNFYSRLFVKMWSPEQIEKILGGMKSISDLLIDTTDWLIHRHKEIEIMCSLLSDTNLPMSNLKEIESTVSSCTRDITLKMDYTQDPLIDNLAKYIKNKKAFKLPVFWIVTSGKNRTEHIIPLLKYFDNLRVTQCSSLDCRYQIGFVPVSSSFKNGAIIPFGCSEKYHPTGVVTATELPDRPIQPSVGTSISQESFYSGIQIRQPEKWDAVSEKASLKLCLKKEEDRFNTVSSYSSILSHPTTSLTEKGKRNSVCNAPAKTANTDEFSSSEVEIESRGNATNISDSSLTRSEVSPQLYLKKYGDQKLYVSSASQYISSLSVNEEINPVSAAPKMVSSHHQTDNTNGFSSSELEIELSSAISSRENLTNLPRKQKTLFDLLSQCFSCLRKR